MVTILIILILACDLQMWFNQRFLIPDGSTALILGIHEILKIIMILVNAHSCRLAKILQSLFYLN